MMLTELTAVPAGALPDTAFRDHLRLGSGVPEDALQDAALEGYLRAAIAAIEARTGKVLIEREFRWQVSAWRGADRQPLPLAPVGAILSVMRVRRDGTEQTVPQDAWRLIPDDQRPVIASTGAALPGVPAQGHIRIDLRAGYAAAWDGLPADLKQAVLLLAAHFHEYRHEAGLRGGALPFGVSSLIERYRTVRLLLGGGS